jgi:hypothetical protein
MHCLAPPWSIYISKPMFEDFKLWTPELNAPKDLIWESGATPNRCTYMVPLFNQFGEKALSNFILEYLVPEIEYLVNLSWTRKIQITQHLLTCQVLGVCWRGLVLSVPPHIHSEGPRRGLLWLSRPSRRFQWIMTCSPRHRWLYVSKYIEHRQVEIESWLGSCCNQLGYLSCNLIPLGYKRKGRGTLEKKDTDNTITMSNTRIQDVGLLSSRRPESI